MLFTKDLRFKKHLGRNGKFCFRILSIIIQYQKKEVSRICQNGLVW